MAMNTNTSLKYEDIISKSDLIQTGSPAIYQLKPKKENIGSLRKMTIGKKNPDKRNKTILLVGETGAGKTTLINALVNYAIGVEWEDDVWFQILESDERSQSESQTSDVIVYQIFGFEDKPLPYSLTIIDTPGYGDIKGTKKDAIFSQRLIDLFRSVDGVHEINGVGLVLKASENQLRIEQLRNIFDSVVSLFGKDLEKNTVALITHSNGVTPENVLQALEDTKIKYAKDEENDPVYFMFNNRQSTQKTKKNKVALKTAWDLTMDQMAQFTDFMEETSPKKLETSVEELKTHTRLTACVKNLQEKIELIDLKQKEIQQTQEALNQHEEEMKNNEKFTVEVDEVYKDKEPLSGGQWGLFYEGAVCCKTCEENCHYPGCTLALTPESCEVMEDGCCTVCGCSVSAHMKEKFKYVNKTKKVRKTRKDVKEKFKKKKAGSEKKLSLLETLEKNMEEFQKEKHQLLDKLFQHVGQLEQITLKVESLSTHVHLDFLIEKMKEKGDTEKTKELEEMKRRIDERTRAAPRNSSSKHGNIISTSDVIQPGLPTLYQLKPKKEDIQPPRTNKENIGSLTRITLGEKNPNKNNKTILLVGETGAGKSTLINALVNYAMGVKWEDDVWFHIVEGEKRSQSESQTLDVIVYQIFGFEDKPLPYSLTIIDTPGYGSTDGIEKDVIIGQRLFDLFRSIDGIHEINAVGLVLKASENRLSDRLRYIFNSVVSLFGKDLEKNIVALITHSNGVTPENALQALEDANIKCAKDEENEPIYFMFDNCQSKQKKIRDKNALRHAWDVTKTEMDKFTEFLKETLPQNLITTVEVLHSQIRLTACINNLQERIKLIDLQQEEIKQTQAGLKKHEEEMKNNKNFTVEVDEVYKHKQPVNESRWWGLWLNYGGAVCCTVCKENCHYPCTLAWYPGHCEVIKDGRCTVCTGKCPASDHVKEKWIYLNKTRKSKKTVQEMKEKHEKGKTDIKMTTSLLETLKKKLEELEKEKDQLLEEAFQHVANLEQVALNAYTLCTYVHLDILIEKMKEKGDTEKVLRLTEMKSKMDKDKGIKAVMRYRFDQLRAAGVVITF